MFSPLVKIAGTVLGAIVLGTVAVVAMGEQYAVVRFVTGKLGRPKIKGKVFASIEDAKTHQEGLAHQGYASIIVHCASDGSLDCMNAVKAMAPHPAGTGGSKTKFFAHGKKIRSPQSRMADAGYGYDKVEYGQPEPDLFPIISGCKSCDLGAATRVVDTQDIFMNEMELTPKKQIPAWARQMNDGPYFGTPEFRDTVSSHQWRTDVQSRTLPKRFFSGDRFNPNRA